MNEKKLTFEEFLFESIAPEDVTYSVPQEYRDKIKFDETFEIDGFKYPSTILYENTMLADEYGRAIYLSKEDSIAAAHHSDDKYVEPIRVISKDNRIFGVDKDKLPNDIRSEYKKYLAEYHENSKSEMKGRIFIKMVKALVKELGIKYIPKDNYRYSSYSNKVSITVHPKFYGIYPKDLELSIDLSSEKVKIKIQKFDKSVRTEIQKRIDFLTDLLK